MRSFARLSLHLCIFAALTLLTQIGGLAYLTALGVAHLTRRRVAVTAAMTIALYGALTYQIVPAVAPHFGRVRLPCAMSPVLGCALNRTYVRDDLADLALRADREMARAFPGTRLTVLDANFPFFDGFPLLPHKSHDDGRKVDFAFLYRDAATGNAIPSGAPSPIGYFHFERPPTEYQPPCHFTALRWDFAWAQPERPAWTLDEERTRAAIQWFSRQKQVTKILLEPYLAERLNVAGGKVRFQGCFAARHDDHFHVQVE
jgi:hypothetical protein